MKHSQEDFTPELWDDFLLLRVCSRETDGKHLTQGAPGQLVVEDLVGDGWWKVVRRKHLS